MSSSTTAKNDATEEQEEEEDDEESLEKLQEEIARMEEEAARLSKETEEINNGGLATGSGPAGSSSNAAGDSSSTTATQPLTAAQQLKVDACSVYVGQVDYSTTPEELLSHFNPCGTIERVTIVCDKFTGKPKGFAYLEFETEAAAANAIKLNDSEFKGRQLKVTSKRVNQPGFYVQQAAAAAVAAGIDPSALAYVGGRGYGRGGRGGPPFRGGRGGGFRGGGRGGHFPRGGGGRGGGFRGGGRASGYHPYY